ncbi:ABC transporter ATP-binding protein [Metabacillus sp. KIGAM252]|uniref:ABC transporter ATP-binding protein n=1 Tax=Metabacillus flavus TaxID=2823519 RepID=A0ABS5LBD4_9BACI|nr:ABC transporter ATP-binding protein [Metabacillus flavus]MBS2967774.1 ABC transporter ATP-binding protein [Metabacillus flavus]
MSNIIEVAGAAKSFGKESVLKSVDFTVKKGEILGLLGPNGAGKTTLIRILNGVITPDQGTIRVAGFDPVTEGDEIRKISGIVTENAGLYHEMSGLDNLKFFAELYKVQDKSEIDRLLKLFDMEEYQHRPAGTYSTGMKKRLALAKALLHKPEILFLDEPTNGLDPDGINLVLSYLKKYNEETGTTIIICSHVLHQLETICDSFAFMENHTIAEQGSLSELTEKYITELSVVIETDWPGRNGMDIVKDGFLRCRVKSKREISSLLKEILQTHSVYSVSIENISVETIYFKIREAHHG